MKICLISASVYSLNIYSGMEIYMRNLPKKLAEKGHQVSVITTSPHKARKASLEEREGVKVYSFNPLNIYERSEFRRKPLFLKLVWHGFDLLWNPHPYAVIRGILKKERPDVVQIHNYRGLSASVFSAVKSLNIPLVFTVHDYSLMCPKSDLLKKSGEICDQPLLVCKLYKAFKGFAVDSKPDLVTADTYFVLDKLKEQGFFKSSRAEKLPTTPIEMTGNEKVDKDFETVDILFVGSLGRFKGVHILLTAFRQLEREDIRLHIAGAGPDEAELRKITADDSRITFYGLVPWEKLTELYRRANVTIVPSVFCEPLGFVILESFRSGTPVVGSNIGGIPEVIVDGYNGRLFEAGNVAELKSTLENLLENPSELKRLGEGAFKSAREYDISNHILKLEELYSQLIK